MKLLITGAKGQLGNELLDMLSTGKSQIGEIDCSYKNSEILAIDIDELDIADESAVKKLVISFAPEIVINCAAMTNVDACETDPIAAMKANAIGARNIAVAAAQVGAKLVHVSTDYVFSGDAEAPYIEWDVCLPKTAYGKSKLLGEDYAMQQCKRTFVVRTAWLYGLVGKNFVKTMRMLGRTKEEISVVNDQRGNPTNANDLAHHILKIALTEEYGIYHCTNEGECSWFDFAKKIMQLSGLSCRVNPCTSEEYPSKTPRPKFSSLKKIMLESTVGNEMRSWEDAIEDYIRLLNQSGNLEG